jgi:peptidyl-prolyl cis-trans isomerase SurA
MIKIRRVVLFSLFYLLAAAAMAQSTTISLSSAPAENEQFPVFSYGDKMVYNDEFLRVFNKNKRDNSEPTQEEIEEYLELYTKFKLKVAEAYSRKMDTIPSFKNELAGYRRQLAQPYLTDKSVTDRLIKEAYDRGLEEIRASHLLINCPIDAKPSDTLEAYTKIMGLRSRVLDGNEDFGTLAELYSDDPSAKTNKGDLGYFTAFQMIYPFENAAFKTKVGEVSLPVRTQFGYHLVNVQDRRKALGDIKVAHIMVKFYNETEVDSTKRKIDAVYAKLQKGADWSTTVEEFSDDFNTNSKGGELNWFNRTTSNIPVEFKDVAYQLKNDGDYSQPIKTRFGWHIIKRISVKPIPSFDESKEVLRRKVERDARSEMNKEVVVARVKVENNFTEVKGLAAVKTKLDSTLLQGEWNRPETTGAVLFKIKDKNYTDEDFYSYLATNKTRTNKALENAVMDYYQNFVTQSNLDFEEQILEDKYPDFKYIMQEYKDGILLFELTDKEVWSKAVSDTAGLEAFYTNNQSKYMWGERADATIYSCKDAKTAKKAMKMAKSENDASAIITKLNAADAVAVKIEDKKFEKGNNALLDKIEWTPGVYNLDAENNRVKFVHIREILPPTAKPLAENLGQATSDYQNHLEKLWIESLKKKYPLVIYKENVKRLYN